MAPSVHARDWKRGREEMNRPGIYRAKLKTRQQMKATIPSDELGWWHDVCPGKTLELRDATAADLARCHLREGTSRDPADYLCENFERGSLVSRKAIAKLMPFPERDVQQMARDAISKFGIERIEEVLAAMRSENAAPQTPTDNQNSAP